MKDYMFLFHGPREPMTILKSPEKMQAHMAKWRDWMGGLAKQGRLGPSQPLEATSGKQVRPGKQPVTDGPFIEGKDIIVGGFMMCKAENYEEAVAIARGCPILEEFDNSVVEVRSVQQMEG
jgi:hypothetical protein